jgi:hypothetical protein
MRSCIARDIEPALAPVGVAPTLEVHTLRILTVEKIRGPHLIAYLWCRP